MLKQIKVNFQLGLKFNVRKYLMEKLLRGFTPIKNRLHFKKQVSLTSFKTDMDG